MSWNTETYSVFEQKPNKSFAEFEEVAQDLISFINKAHRIKLSEIVIDFTKDQVGEYFFVGVKYFRVEQYEKVNELYFQKSEGNLVKQENLKFNLFDNSTGLSNYLHNFIGTCKLCKLQFMREEMSRSVTFKMIKDLITHMQKRGIFIY